MEAKRLLRAKMLAARAARPTEQREPDERSIAEHGIAEFGAAATVAAYVSVGTEPGTRILITRLREQGARVLLPVVDGAELMWGEFADWDQLRTSPLGLLEPVPAPGAAALAASPAVVVVPALAVDRAGNRLGRGGGHYDRWLPKVAPGVPVVAVVFADEVVEEVPHEAHDVPVVAALTPRGVVQLGQ